MKTLKLLLALSGLLLLVTVVHAVGGGYLVTVKDFPDYAVAGKPLNFSFKVWVPSEEPVRGVHPSVNATNAKGRTITVKATALSEVANFKTMLTFPEAGDWVITVDTGYQTTMPPLQVIAPGTTPPTPLSLAARGKRLFVAKGCNSCHLHEEVEGSTYAPDLRGKRFPTEYLKRFLADPSITPVPDVVCVGTRCGSPYAMPSLNLKNAEIEALVAFINKK